ncbi:non-ribosomal peptide synthetase [Salinispora fenicalii]|uniref:non-ribosomal peptide synthetase n=1 Tax=Salinispora fenicalii TaxID=1137263 RepID=UPI00048305AA|nr:non-ribosomal peptide synthetase [Salinispora fenicalii]
MSQSSAGDLLAELESAGVRVWSEAGQLRFRAPRGVLTVERRDALRARRDEILAYLDTAPDPAALVPDPEHRHDPFPVTDVQAAYLLGRGETFAYGRVACHGYGELSYPELDPERMTAAWRALIDRHDMLRAVVEADGAQRVLPEVPPFEVPVIDLTGRPPAVAEAALHAVRAEMDHLVHTPDQWPLFAARITTADDRAVLHVSIDFLIADFISVQVILDELHRLYHRPNEPLPPLEITFRDYQLAERAARSGPGHERDKRWWLARVDDLPAAPELPTVARPADSDGRFRRWETRIPPDAWALLRQRAGRHGISPSGAVLAAYADTIAAWSRRSRFTLDLTLLNRMPLHPQVNALVGDFTSVDLLVVDAEPTRPFHERARDLQAQLWEDLDHRSFSGIELMREIARRQGPEAALFPIVFTSAIGISDAGSAAGDAPLGELGYGISQTPQVWIDCQNIERDGGLVSNWDVREEVFPPGLVADMFAAYERLLHRLAIDDAAWTGTGYPEPPRAQLDRRAEVNRTTAPPPAGMLHDRVVRQALRTPDRPAVVTGDGALSYAELLGRATGVAEALTAAGCRRQELVGIVTDRGWEQVVAVLGALLAGCVYVPVDTSQPAARRRTILEAAGVRCALAQSWVEPSGWADGIRLLAVDTLPVGEPGPVDGSGDPEELAYVIHTSGSTGTPKGVMINHRGALNTVLDINARFDVGPDDRVLGLSNLGFDLSVYDIFGPLSVGGAVVLPDSSRRGDPSHWSELVAAHTVTIWNSVPAQLQMMYDYLEAAPAATAPDLRLAMLSGDWIPVALPDQIRQRVPGLRVVSLGGATEASIWSIWYPIEQVEPEWRSIPYGRPLTNQTFHVLDSALCPRPELVTGELYIGGVGLALGYLNDPARSADRFVTHPETGETLYRTGDLGRYLPDGTIEFLGREDLQVKIRGYRIELAEIESALGSHPGVAAAAVVVDGDSPLERRLAAFVEPASRSVTTARATSEAAAAQQLGVQACADADGTLDGVDRARYLTYAHRLDAVALPAMLDAFRAAGLFVAGRRHTRAELLHTAGVAPRHHRLVRRWLRALTGAGLLDVDTDDRYGLTETGAAADTGAAWRSVDKIATAEDVELLAYFRASTGQLPALLRGEDDPLTLLFPQGKVDVSQGLYERTLFNRWANEAAASLVRRVAEQRVEPGALRVLEIGAGAGGTTAAVLAALDGNAVDYLATDLSPFFVNELRTRFGERPGLHLQPLDIDQDLVGQGLAPNSFDVVVAGDVLHASTDVVRALARLRAVLAPQGWLVACEMTRDHHQIMTSLELLVRVDEATADFTDLRQGTEQVFLGRETWLDVLGAAGASQPLCLPEPNGFIAELGMCVLAAQFKTDRERIARDDVATHLAERVPEYMVPAVIQIVDTFPLTANGKVDRAALRRRLPRRESMPTTVSSAPGSDLERGLAAVWAEALRVPRIGRDENLFELGGDSLVAAQITGRVLNEIPQAADLFFDQVLRQVLEQPTVAALAGHIEAESAATTATDGVGAGATTSDGGLAILDDTNPGIPWVLVPSCDGSVDGYTALVPHLAATGPVFGLTAGLLDDLPRVAAEQARSITGAGCAAVRLVGHGLGATLALEVARALTEAGEQVAELVLISPWRPVTLPDAAEAHRAENGDAAIGEGFAARLAATVGYEPNLYAGDITVLRPTGEVPYSTDELEFWSDLCLGEVRELDVDGDHRAVLGEKSVAAIAAADPGSAR